ncbi:MAG: urate hydroxylase PuuD [Bdellovibrionota bacterium]
MEFAILTFPGLHFLFKWLHIFFGLLWIGHLYYFNFTQGAYMAQADAAGKSQVTTKLVPIALWWFRWGAMWTFITGLLMLHTAGYTGFSLQGDWGIKILTGGVFGILMWFNVWFIIWPNQKVIIQSATQAVSGGQAIPTVPALAGKALLASRTNVLFSIPMLFYMIAAGHLPIQMNLENQMTYYIAFLVLVAALEFNAIKGKLGPMATVKGVITCGFGLTALVYLMMEVIL